MRAVWSFWSKPFTTYYGRIWSKPLHHLLAWGLSLDSASRHYPDTMLATDRMGKKLLVDQLGLQFVHVSTELEMLQDVDPGWWALGKLVACSLQDRPFVHLDNDVFLWKALPRDVAESPVLAQCPYSFTRNDPYFRPQEIELAFAQEALELPAEWIWARTNRDNFPAANGGVLGGSSVEFLRYYARNALDLILKPQHGPAWARLAEKWGPYVLIEEFFLVACVEYHRLRAASPYWGVRMSHVFPSYEHAYDPSYSARVGYTHLMGGAKSHPAVGMRIEQRARRQIPDFYRRCEQVLMKSVFPL
jgi:hypothetical protein